MIQAIIVDDEPAAAIIIRYLIKNEELPIQIVGEAQDVSTAIEMIDQHCQNWSFWTFRCPDKTALNL